MLIHRRQKPGSFFRRVARLFAEAGRAHAAFLVMSPQVTVTMFPTQVIAMGGEEGGGGENREDVAAPNVLHLVEENREKVVGKNSLDNLLLFPEIITKEYIQMSMYRSTPSTASTHTEEENRRHQENLQIRSERATEFLDKDLYTGRTFRVKNPDDLMYSEYGCQEMLQCKIIKFIPATYMGSTNRVHIEIAKRCRNLPIKTIEMDVYKLNDMLDNGKLILGPRVEAVSRRVLPWGGGRKIKKHRTKHAAKPTKRRRTRRRRR